MSSNLEKLSDDCIGLIISFVVANGALHNDYDMFLDVRSDGSKIFVMLSCVCRRLRNLTRSSLLPLPYQIRSQSPFLRDEMMWLIKRCAFWTDNRSACDIAASKGQWRVFEYARSLGCECSHHVCDGASKHGKLDIIQWMHNTNNCECRDWNKDIIDYASCYGHLEIVKWAHGNGFKWSNYAWNWAAMNGHLDILKWLHYKGIFNCERLSRSPIPSDACDFAADEGHLKVIVWLRRKGYNWSSRTRFNAANKGHIGILKWLRAQDPSCP